MATLTFTQIRTRPKDAIEYIARRDAVISEKTHDVYGVLNYMGEPESTERVFVFSRHCSSNPRLAAQEVELYRQAYYQSKPNARHKDDELLGLHFFQSYTVEDNPSMEVMGDIIQRLLEHPLLKDFATLAAHHFDKTQKHTHFYACQFSAQGKPRKMGLKHDDLDELMRFSNRLCVEHGLSIIDKKDLRKDKAYSNWLDDIIAEGRITVHPEKKIHKCRSKKKEPIKNHYYRWMKENEERAEEEYRLLTEIQRKKKHFEETYYYTPDGDENRRWYVSGDPKRHFYAVPLHTEDGYLRSPLELLGLFIVAVSKREGEYIRQRSTRIYSAFKVEVDRKVQGLIDAIHTAKVMNVNRPEDVAVRLADVGKQMNCLRRAKRQHEENLASWKSAAISGIQSPKDDDSMLQMRRVFAQRKVTDYEKRLKELDKQYHDLKRLEVVVTRPELFVSRIFEYSAKATNDRDIDDIIASANERSKTSANTQIATREDVTR